MKIQFFGIQRSWYHHHKPPFYLRPFSFLFSSAVRFRRFLYRQGWKRVSHFSVPVIVVGNITVGGTGKTPFVIWLSHFLKLQGYSPGIVSRGYGGTFDGSPHRVEIGSDPRKVGDEPLLIAQRSQCPVIIAHQRVKAVEMLLQHQACDVVISDDGLQHYALGRSIEIALLDAARGVGNGYCLPAGPLREPVSRLKEVDFVVEKGKDFWLVPDQCILLTSPSHHHSLSYFKNQRVHAVAGIAHPQAFFDLLTQAGLEVIPHAFPDHHIFSARDFSFGEDLSILMTEKDAVKMRSLARENMWYVPVNAEVPDALGKAILERL